MFDSFAASKVDVVEAEIFIRRKGSGRSLLLLHGFPETHLMWHAVAPALADAEKPAHCASPHPCSRLGCRSEDRFTSPNWVDVGIIF
jgi:pimeloyl-ACP methyl ester carboxylesterase